MMIRRGGLLLLFALALHLCATASGGANTTAGPYFTQSEIKGIWEGGISGSLQYAILDLRPSRKPRLVVLDPITGTTHRYEGDRVTIEKGELVASFSAHPKEAWRLEFRGTFETHPTPEGYARLGGALRHRVRAGPELDDSREFKVLLVRSSGASVFQQLAAAERSILAE